MKIIDRTPFRSETGEIDIIGRVRGSLKYGLTWYNRLQAQDTVIAIMEKVLGQSYVLLRNITLPGTEIDLPLVLLGPSGIFLINVTHERGVYRAKDDEWGTISNENFVPAGINMVGRTVQMGRVLQVYLDRAGYKGMLMVDPILMAADPGMHIDSVRPAVRIVMSDALERFAISLSQGRAIFAADAINAITKTIMTGPKKQATDAPAQPAQVADPATGNQAASSGAQVDPFAYAGGSTPVSTGPMAPVEAFSGEAMGFSFDEEQPADESGSQQGSMAAQASGGFSDQSSGGMQPSTAQGGSSARRGGFMGMTTSQLIILGVILLFWLCAMIGFGAYIYFNLNA